MTIQLHIERAPTILRRMLLVVCMSFVTSGLYGQETIFTMLKSDDRKANDYFKAKNYRQALDLYKMMTERAGTDQYYLPIARSYYYLHQPTEASQWYLKVVERRIDLPVNDLFLYAESLSAQQRYDEAIALYTQYQSLNTDDPLVMKKIWQLKNKEFLFEDSIHYSITPLAINSPGSDFAAVRYGDGFVFLSNRKRPHVIDNVDGDNQPFYRTYLSIQRADTADHSIRYDTPVGMLRELNLKYQQGPVSFYDGQRQAAYISSGSPSSKDKESRSLQLFFAQKIGEAWIPKQAFDHNSSDYSISSVYVQEDGQKLYFTSDMAGGHGGTDLYESTFAHGKWSKPVNLGETINTKGDESFPSVFGNMIYFSSNGHAGLGGFDLFKSLILPKGFEEAENMGYPINTHADDFALSLNGDGSKGYVTSNRDGMSDNIFEVTIDLQTYPFTIAGALKYKEESWKEHSDLKVLPNVQLLLIDNLKNTVVQTSTSDSTGLFSLTIPYFSQYKIKVVGDSEIEEAVVSLDLGKTRNVENKYEIVVVKNAFRKSY